MGERRLDDLAVALATASSRRGVLRALLVGIAALFRPRAAGVRARQQAGEEGAAPSPNLSFLVALPTDAPFAGYGLDSALTGPPTRFLTLDALTSLPDAWRAILQPAFRAAYGATIASPHPDEPSRQGRSITTLVIDLGTAADAAQIHTEYTRLVFVEPTLEPMESPPDGGDRLVFGGCRGGCGRLSAALPSATEPGAEMAVIGRRDRFLFDARIRDYATEPIPDMLATTLAGVVDAKLDEAAQATVAASAGAARALPDLGGAHAAETPRRTTTDGVKRALLARNTLPLFVIGTQESPVSTTQWLLVDDGQPVAMFGEDEERRIVARAVAADVAYALRLERRLALSRPYRGGYELTIAATQFVFASEADARRFLRATRARLQRERRSRNLSQVADDDTEQRFAYDEETPDKGTRFGLNTHAWLQRGSVPAVVAVDLAASPLRAGQRRIDRDALQRELGPLVASAVRELTGCLTAAGTCAATAVLPPPGD